MLAALGAVLLLSPASFCDACDRLLERFVYDDGQEIAVLVEEVCSYPEATDPCFSRAMTGVRAATARRNDERCRQCDERVARATKDPTPATMREVQKACMIPATASCAASAREAVESANRHIDSMTRKHADLATQLAADDEPFRALEEIRRALAISPGDKELKIVEKTLTQASIDRLAELEADEVTAIEEGNLEEADQLRRLIDVTREILNLHRPRERIPTAPPQRLDPMKIIRKCRGCPEPPERG